MHNNNYYDIYIKILLFLKTLLHFLYKSIYIIYSGTMDFLLFLYRRIIKNNL